MKWFFFFIFSVVLLSACTTRPVTPSRNSRQTIDTIYQRKIILLQPEMDSVCGNMRKTIFNLAVDSIMTSRQLEMNNLVK